MLLTRALDPRIDLLDLHRVDPARYPVLLESSSVPAHGHAGERSTRWDLLLVAAGGRLDLGRDGVVRREDGRAVAGDFLGVLDAEWRTAQQAAGGNRHDGGRWPFHGGWALLLAYELAAQVEPVLRLPQAPGGLPVARALRCPAAVLRDHASGVCVLLCEREHAGLLETVLRDVEALAALPAMDAWMPPRRVAEDDPARFTDGVRRILDYLAAGDLFQANLSRGWQAEFASAIAPAALHARLRAANPAPFAGLFHGGAWAVVSASPERLVSVRGDVVETRPIAGTRPRLPGDDEGARIHELVGHHKERAEHVMLVDLERNDLGRVCVPGSVDVDEMMVVESYAHVHHIVSNVRGRLRGDATPGAVIRAVFPGGTITGCPKVRCMQVIAELEGVGRGAYTGAMGWLGRNGDLDLNILIRSAELEGDRLRFRAGAGIVADSDPERELDETRAKARGMLRALGAGR